MSNRIDLGTFMGLQFKAHPNTIPNTIILWVTLSFVSYSFLDLTLMTAILSGLVSTLLHWDSAIWHQIGHSIAARRTGYPMKGMTMWGLMGASHYPEDEPELQADIHIRRALGGPKASLMVSFVSGLAALALRPVGGAVWMVTVFWFLDNFFVFTIGSLLPLGFTDGSTLLEWWPRRENKD